jgi:uncharacterized protein YdhG (YjbR/CyaY superfamily)
MPKKPSTIDEYLASVSADRQAALEKVRRTIHSILPGVEECISYSMPAFRYDGHVVAGFLATGKGCSYYPFSGTTLETLASDLDSYETTKSALHFDPKRSLPAALVRKLLNARIAEMDPSRRSRAKSRSLRAVADRPRGAKVRAK